jgi:DUF1680 family protein
LGKYLWSEDEGTVYSHLFIGSEVETRYGRISMTSGYPWEGKAEYTIHDGGDFALTIHVPQHAVKVSLHVNGEEVSNVTADGYCRIQRNWRQGDRVVVEFDMPVRRIHAHPCVRDAAGKVALARGPLVYCVEDADHEAILSGIVLPADAAINASESSAEGMVVLHAEGTAQSSSDELYSDRTISTTAVQIRAIPYFAWGNRTLGNMQVWIRE